MTAALGPTLTTDRLTLRPLAEGDFEAIRRFGQSERTRFIGGKADEFTMWRAFLAGIGHWHLRGYGLFSVIERASGAFVGRAGPIFHLHHSEPELAWHLFDGFEGRGYATEASAAARDWYHASTGNDPLMSWIDPENTGSVRVAERLGATPEGWHEMDNERVRIWRHIAPTGGGNA
ncbi:GNAT family N-acetyltransferase [Frigidibacter sp. ROC022]|uniref:GNAT family N-acetyltransferase n=1 Tax=Frigidibacter sp. ROC022 TaxID=2971796 RepID=UPI00215A63A9|nr:GNAT family N-acetyltransferase [Frigidibacter sp. ROC022]MCR8724033.1 GNAT family N-acetyltransferase [Frigidibacter sp. ROC022]